MSTSSKPTSSRLRAIGLRVLAVVAGLGLWFTTQSLIGARGSPDGCIWDGLHALTAGVNAWLAAEPARGNALLISSSFVIDLLGLFLLGSSIFGPSIRPFLGLLAIFALRQASQGLTGLVPPEGMIWRYPGVPSLLVTYGVASDLFFSGHTSIAVWGGIEIARRGFPGARWLGLFVAVFEATTVLVLRAHYTMDVFTGVVVSLLIATQVDRWAAPVDRWLAAWASPKHRDIGTHPE
ncbi:MAG: phosphatase PAP2-related protein [Isosphaeraceae bacterium]